MVTFVYWNVNNDLFNILHECYWEDGSAKALKCTVISSSALLPQENRSSMHLNTFPAKHG